MNEYYDTNVHSISDINFVKNAFILLSSKRRSGKTVLLKNILLNIMNNNYIHFIILFSKTSDITKDYDFIDKKI